MFFKYKNSVNYFIISFKSKKNDVHEMMTYLEQSEIHRANQFAFEHLRDKFIICRGYLRKCLSKYLHVNPKEIKFSYTSYGKPEIDFPKDNQSIHFNLSHSNDFFVIAISLLPNVGVDIEYCDKNINVFEIAHEVFSPNEISKLSMVKENQIFEFFKMWSIKEAFIKALGYGFSFDPKWIEIYEEDNTFRATDTMNKKMLIHPECWNFTHHFFNSNYSLACVTPRHHLKFDNNT